MKRTAVTSPKASDGRLTSLIGRTAKVRLGVVSAFVLFGISMFVLGRGTAPTPENLANAVHELQLQVRLQQGAVDRLAANNQQSVNALAVRLAKLALNTSSRTGHQTGTLVEQLAQAVLFESEDKHARMTEFLERKAARRREKSS